VVFLALSILIFSIGCDDLEEQKEDVPDIHIDDDDHQHKWDYPYYLVIGGGLSETLSLLTIKGDSDFSLANNVQLTAGAISQTVVYQEELYAVCSLSHSVMVYDIHDLSIKREISVGVGANPVSLSFQNEKKAYLSNFLSNTVTVYDLSSDNGKLLAAIPMPSGINLPKDKGVNQTWARPGSLVMVGDKVYCPLSNLDDNYSAGGPGLVAVMDTENNSVEKVIELEGRNTVSLYYQGDSDILYAISAGDYKGEKGFVGNGMVETIHIPTGQVTGSVDIGGAPIEMAISPYGAAYLGNGKKGTILSFDPETLEILDPIDIGNPDDEFGLSFASALAMDGAGYLFAAEFNHDRLFVIDTGDQNKIIAIFTTNDGPDTLGFIR